VFVAVVLSACAALAAFEGFSNGDAMSRSGAAARGLTPGIGPMALQARLDSVSDESLLVRAAGRRGSVRAGALGLGLLVALAAARRATANGRRGSRQRTSMASASSRAPPATVALS
jgi:hypothetical protein